MAITTYAPAAANALYNAFVGVSFDDPKAYIVAQNKRIDAKYFLKPVQDEILNLIQKQLVGGGGIQVRNATGGTLNAGPVSVSGYYALDGVTGNTIFKIVAADASGNSKPAHVILTAALLNNTTGTAFLGGNFTGNIDLSAGAVGDPIYVAVGGGITRTAPSGADQIVQIIGRIQTNVNNGVVSGHVELPTIIGTSWLQPASITTAKIAAGTSAQILMSNATPAATWTTMSGDCSITATGAISVNKVVGSTGSSGQVLMGGTPSWGYGVRTGTVSGGTTVTSTANLQVLGIDTSAGNATVTLTAAATVSNGFTVWIWKKTSDANTVIVTPDAADQISGLSPNGTAITISKQYGMIGLVSTGSSGSFAWVIINSPMSPYLNKTSNALPTSGNVMIADGNQWVTNAISGDATITSAGVVSVTSVSHIASGILAVANGGTGTSSGSIKGASGAILHEGTAGTGSDGVGNDFKLAGGQGTGAGEPGLLAQYFYCKIASGTGAQSLGAQKYVIPGILATTSAATTTNASDSGATTGNGKSIIGNLVGSQSIDGGMWRTGRAFRIKIMGLYTATAVPTTTFKVLVGSVVICSSTVATTLPNVTNTFFELEIIVTCRGTPGATCSINAVGLLLAQSAGGGSAGTHIISPMDGSANINTGTTANLDVTALWSANTASNSLQVDGLSIEVIN